MKRTMLYVVPIALGGIVWMGTMGTAPVGEGPAFLCTLAAAAQDGGEAEYLGNKGCKKCHIATERSWSKTPHGEAFKTLKPGEDKEIKVKYNLDPEKDYTQDPQCVECHVVGFDKPGGYSIPDPNDKKAMKEASKLEDVGCESCHGPGSKYVKVFEEIADANRKYKVEELYAAGLNKIDEQTCTKCHNERSPVWEEDKKFDFEEMKKKGVHEHEELKLRED